MTWIPLVDIGGLDRIREASQEKPQLIFKHSTRCGISSSAKWRIDGDLDKLGDKMDLHYLDLLSYRSISNAIANSFDVHHASPQVIVVHQGEAIMHASHAAIDPDSLLRKLASLV